MAGRMMTSACCSSGHPATPVQILPKQLVAGMLDFYNNYKQAVAGSGAPGADEGLVASVMSAIADRFAERRVSTPVTTPECGQFRLLPVLSTAAERPHYHKSVHIGMNTCTPLRSADHIFNSRWRHHLEVVEVFDNLAFFSLPPAIQFLTGTQHVSWHPTAASQPPCSGSSWGLHTSMCPLPAGRQTSL